MAKPSWSRREFLGRAGGSLLFCGVFGGTAEMLAGCETHGEVPRISGQLRRFVTPTEGPLEDDFYVQFGNPRTTADNHPRLAPEDWSLAITGAVTNPLTITWDDLMAAAETDAIVFLKTMRCVFDAPSESLISNGYWRGVPLGRFIQRASPSQSAQRLYFTGEDGFTNNLRLPRVLESRGEQIDEEVPLIPVVLAYELNGEAIPTIHGGPVRLVVPEKFGYKNMKWPREVEVTESDAPFGYYEVSLFDRSPATDVGNIALTSVFSGPIQGEAVRGPTVDFFGVAIDGPGGIDRVEVALDGGPFEAAEIISLDALIDDPILFFGEDTSRRREQLESLKAELVQLTDARFESELPYVWALWQFSAELSAGEHTAEVRAFSTDGAEQPEVDGDPDDGNSQIRSIGFSVR